MENVNIKEGGVSWLLRFPDELVILIANLEDGATKPVAQAWAGSAEVPGDADGNEPVIRDLKRLALPRPDKRAEPVSRGCL